MAVVDWVHLPEELLFLIFKLLEVNNWRPSNSASHTHSQDVDLVSASSTCKRWRHVYHDPSLWRSRTFEFRGYYRSHLDRLEMVDKYVKTMGCWLRELRVRCMSPNLLTAHSAAQCVHKLLAGLSGLPRGTTTLTSFSMAHLFFHDTWGCFRSSKRLLMDALVGFVQVQRCLVVLDLSYAFLSPPFAYRLMRAVMRSRSARTLEVLHVHGFYNHEASARAVGQQLRAVMQRCSHLREVSLDYSSLQAAGLTDLAQALGDSLHHLLVHVTPRNQYLEPHEIIDSESWVLACGLCPRLQVAFRVDGWMDELKALLVAGIPLARFSITGSHFRHAVLPYGAKASLMLEHLAEVFPTTLREAVLEVTGERPPSRVSTESMTNFLVACRKLGCFAFSSSLLRPELLEKVKVIVREKAINVKLVTLEG